MFRIKVTQRHIDEGVPGNVCSCMVALALEEASGGLSVVVGAWDVTFRYAKGVDGAFNVDLPYGVEKKIVLFDSGKTVKPFSFSL